MTALETESKAQEEKAEMLEKQLEELNSQLKEAQKSSKKSEIKKYATIITTAVSFFCIGYITNEFRSK